MMRRGRISGGIHAVYPWFSPESGGLIRRTQDAQEQIDRCLCCPYPECIDCVACGGRHTGRPNGRPSRYDPEQLRQVLHLSDRQICTILCVSIRTLRNYKSKLKREDITV